MTLAQTRAVPWQMLRALVMAVVTVGLSAAAHGAGGAAAPTVSSTALLTALSAIVALPLLLRWKAPVALVPLLTAAQGALHPAFGALADAPMSQHAAHGMTGGGGSAAAMLMAHLAAGLLAASLVVLLDRSLAAAFHGRTLWPVLSAPIPVAGRTRPACGFDTRGRSHRSVDLVHLAPRRGPPVEPALS